MIKDENFFEKCMKIWETVNNRIKKVKSELTHNIKYLKAENKFITKKDFNVFIYSNID